MFNLMTVVFIFGFIVFQWVANYMLIKDCLLYTSDAADERSSVDLGGRRIIKKKKQEDKHAGLDTQWT